jgi:hypothetical protein
LEPSLFCLSVVALTIAFQHTQHLPRNLGVDVKGYSSEQYPQYQEDQLDYKLVCGFSLFHQKDSDALPENERRQVCCVVLELPNQPPSTWVNVNDYFIYSYNQFYFKEKVKYFTKLTE